MGLCRCSCRQHHASACLDLRPHRRDCGCAVALLLSVTPDTTLLPCGHHRVHPRPVGCWGRLGALGSHAHSMQATHSLLNTCVGSLRARHMRACPHVAASPSICCCRSLCAACWTSCGFSPRCLRERSTSQHWHHLLGSALTNPHGTT